MYVHTLARIILLKNALLVVKLTPTFLILGLLWMMMMERDIHFFLCHFDAFTSIIVMLMLELRLRKYTIIF